MSPRAAPRPPVRLLLVDDSSRMREGWAMLLRSQPDFEVVGQAADAAQALTQARRHPLDVVLMDLQLPGVSGLAATERIVRDERVRAQGSAPRILLFATVDLDEAISGAAQVGAYAVLYKDVDPEALFQTIREAAASR